MLSDRNLDDRDGRQRQQALRAIVFDMPPRKRPAPGARRIPGSIRHIVFAQERVLDRGKPRQYFIVIDVAFRMRALEGQADIVENVRARLAPYRILAAF